MRLVCLSVILALGSGQSWAAPKYGPNAQSLSSGAGGSYFKRGPGPDFFHLIPFYSGQDTGSACSLATLVTLLNGVQALNLTGKVDGSTKNITAAEVREKWVDPTYVVQVSGDKKLALEKKVSLGIPISDFRAVVRQALEASRLLPKAPVVDFIGLQSRPSRIVAKEKEDFIHSLEKNEASSREFMILNFTQGILTGDSEGMVGHVALVGAYDRVARKVLILDPDREYYEPYWSPVEKVFEAMIDSHADRKTPGYLIVRL